MAKIIMKRQTTVMEVLALLVSNQHLFELINSQQREVPLCMGVPVKQENLESDL